MTEQENKPQLWNVVAIALLALAAWVRLFQLGVQPLSETESGLALAAGHVSSVSVFGSQQSTIYTALTEMAFWLFEPSSFLARVVPALVGISLVALPLLLRKQIGPISSLALAFFLALDPSMVVLSRTANTHVFALAAFGFLIWSYLGGRGKLFGFFASLLLMSGLQGWLLAITALLCIAIEKYLFKAQLPSNLWDWLARAWKAIFGGFLLPIGSLVLLAWLSKNPALVSIPVSGLVGSIQNLFRPSSGWFTQIPLAFVLYEGFAIVLGLLGVKKALEGHGQYRLPLLVLLLVCVFSILLPNRQAIDVAWIIPVLLFLGAVFVSDFIASLTDLRKETGVMFMFSLVLFIFMALNYLALAMVTMDPSTTQLRWTVLIGSFTMLAASLVLVTYGWSFQIAWQGMVSAILVFFVALNVGNVWASAHLRPAATQELWDGPDVISPGDPLRSQLDEISRLGAHATSLDTITMIGISSPALEWQLSGKSTRSLQSVATMDEMGPLVLTQQGVTDAQLVDNYRGKDIVVSYNIPFDALTLGDWMRWTVTHTFPLQENKIILWMRADKFLDVQNSQ